MTHNNPSDETPRPTEPLEEARKGDPQEHHPVGVYDSCGSRPRVGEDLFRRGGGLGLPAYQLLGYLDRDETSTAKQLAEETGIHPGSVRSKLRRMAELGMAERDDDGGWRATGFDARSVAEQVGTAGRAAAQQRRLREESRLRDEAVRQWRQWQTDQRKGEGK